MGWLLGGGCGQSTPQLLKLGDKQYSEVHSSIRINKSLYTEDSGTINTLNSQGP